MRSFSVLVLIGAASCVEAAPPVSRPVTMPPRLSAGESWPASVAACTISEGALWPDEDCDAFQVDVLRAPGDASPFAQMLSTYGTGHAKWTGLPPIRASSNSISNVEITAEGLHVRGFASLLAHRYRLRRTVTIHPGHVYIPAGSAARVIGTSGDRIGIEIDTPFDDPKTWQLLVACDAFGAPDRVIVAPTYASSRVDADAVAVGPTLSVLDAPGGREVVTVHPAAARPFVWLGENGGFVHVLSAGDASGAVGLMVDGWVRSSNVRRTKRVVNDDRDFGDCADSRDICVENRPSRDAPVFVGKNGPEGDAIGNVDAHTPLVLEEKSGGFTAFHTANEVVHAAHPGKLWIAQSDVEHVSDCGEHE